MTTLAVMGGHGYTERNLDMAIWLEMGDMAILRERGTWLY